jgi:glucokinase
MAQYLGIEIGGTKLQLGVGNGDGVIGAQWRGNVDPREGAKGIRRQILDALPDLLQGRRIDAAGIGFGGPVDDSTQRIIKSHQIEGWDGFPIAQWLSDVLHAPAFLGNDADVAGLAEACFGAGKGLSPIFYITIGSGIGGGFIVDSDIYRAVGRGAAEVGHLRVLDRRCPDRLTIVPLEQVASGWAIGEHARRLFAESAWPDSLVLSMAGGDIAQVTAWHVGKAAKHGDAFALARLDEALDTLSEAICSVITLLCPRRIVIGGGVPLIGEEYFFEPLRAKVAERIFAPFAGLTDIVPASLGESVVVHGALALARTRAGG